MKKNISCQTFSGPLEEVEKHSDKKVTSQYTVQFEGLESESAEQIVDSFYSIDQDSKELFDKGSPKLLVSFVNKIPGNILEFLNSNKSIQSDENNICAFLFRSSDGHYKFFSSALLGRSLDENEDIPLTDLSNPDLIEETNKMLDSVIKDLDKELSSFVKVMDSESIPPELITAFGIKHFHSPVFEDKVSFMDLSGHNLYKRSLDELKTILSSIPAHIKFLKLSHNLNDTAACDTSGFGAYSIFSNRSDIESREQFIEGLQAVSSNIIYLDLTKNNIPEAEWPKMLDRLPDSIKFVALGDDVLINMIDFKEKSAQWSTQASASINN